jgi:tRNA threonylcarbamoyladenosine biosynthesis protein TsaB
MTILLIENSTENTWIALVKEGILLVKKDLGNERQASSLILEAMRQELWNIQVDLKEISSIIVGDGPGSYTGVRIASIIAKTLCFVLKIPLIQIPSIKGLLPTLPGKFLALLDARAAGFYAIEGIKTADSVVFLGESRRISHEELADALKEKDYVVSPLPSLLNKSSAIIWEQKNICPECFYLLTLKNKSVVF